MDEQNKVNEGEVKKVMTEKIPEKMLGDMNKHAKEKQQCSYQLLQITINILNAQEQQKDILTRMKRADDDYKKQVQYAFNKMRLNRDKNYQWRFDGRDSFTGTLIEKKDTPK